ncbi:MAG TPA: class I SAM-dependent methyltransferase [Candidatus Methanoperedens sp.]|nr:class I SAM-dependent methyltransferase [Candidatus Methanoperedens sp.]
MSSESAGAGRVPETSASFDRDVREGGAYRYTDGTRFSARLANERYTALILGATDFTGKSVVDVGAGDGTYTAEIARRTAARTVLGMEPSAEAARRAAACYAGDAPRLSFRQGVSADLLREGLRFDIAVYRGVVHHVPDAPVELQAAVRLAATVIILEPNGLNAAMKAAERLSRYHREHAERSFSPFTLARWVREAGGEPLRLQPFGLVPYFSPDWAARVGRLLEPLVERVPLLRLAACGQYLVVARGRPA